MTEGKVGGACEGEETGATALAQGLPPPKLITIVIILICFFRYEFFNVAGNMPHTKSRLIPAHRQLQSHR